MSFEFDTTIAAISTGMTPSGIGIVRMTGKDSFEIADRVYKSKKNKRLADQKSHTIHYGYVVDGDEMIDEALFMLMRGPHTFTGEDTVEINCHGGVFVVKKVLENLIRHGAKVAEPGEFTKRAFLNGKLDLSQAEAVGDLIASKNEYALQSSISQLRGNLKDKIKEIRAVILHHTAFIETALDDPEHYDVDNYGITLGKDVDKLILEVDKLLKTCEDGRILKEGIKTVIIGKPNAGKSSILNRVLGEDRAIVTDIAGTTRDTLEEQVNLQGISLNMIDTAGIHDTSDVVEKIGVDLAKKQAEKADLILCVLDASKELEEEDKKILDMIKNKKSIILLNKSDLENIISKESVYNYLIDSINLEKTEDADKTGDPKINGNAEKTADIENIGNTEKNTDTENIGNAEKTADTENIGNAEQFDNSENRVKNAGSLAKMDLSKAKKLVDENVKLLEISAKTGDGTEQLKEMIKGLFFEGKLAFNSEIYITNVRHKTALQEAKESLKKVKSSIEMDLPEDFFSIDLLDAYDHLGTIIGEATGEDLINEIFSKFCMGK